LDIVEKRRQAVLAFDRKDYLIRDEAQPAVA
jgi:hypothetical protein